MRQTWIPPVDPGLFISEPGKVGQRVASHLLSGPIIAREKLSPALDRHGPIILVDGRLTAQSVQSHSGTDDCAGVAVRMRQPAPSPRSPAFQVSFGHS